MQHDGVGYAYLGKANASTGTASQVVVIPAGTAPMLGFWINVTPQDPSTSAASDFGEATSTPASRAAVVCPSPSAALSYVGPIVSMPIHGFVIGC